MPETAAPPTVSIVVPVYGVEEYVEECLRSILDQTFTDLQVVVVDDGSTDGSMEIVERIAALDERVEVHRYPNGGLGRARNRGLKHATGTYVAFVDSDDVLPRGAVAALVSALETTGSDFATGNVERLTNEGRRRSPQHHAALSRRSLRTTLAAQPDLVYSTTSCNSLFRRTFWDRAGLRFAQDRLYEDMETTAHACARATSIDVVGSVTYLWRRRDDGTSITQGRSQERNLVDRVEALRASRLWFAVSGADVLRAFDEKVVAMDLLLYAPAMVEASSRTRRTLRRECAAAVARLGGVDALDDLPVRARVLHELVSRRAWAALPAVAEFFRAHGSDLPLEDVHDGEGLVVLPGQWDGTSIPRLAARTRRVHGDDVRSRVTLEHVGWVDDVLEVRGHARLRQLPTDAVRVEWTAVSGQTRVALRTEVEQGPDGAAFVATVHRKELVVPSVRSWALEVRVEAAGAVRVDPVVPGALRGTLAVVQARGGADDRVVVPVVERGEPLRIDVRKPPFWLESARVVGRDVELVVRSAGKLSVARADLTSPASDEPLVAPVEQRSQREFVVRAQLPTDTWPADGTRRATWRVLLWDAAEKSHQAAVGPGVQLESDNPAIALHPNKQGWIALRVEPFRFEVVEVEATPTGVRVVGTGPTAVGNELVLRAPSGEVLVSSGAEVGPGEYLVPWPAQLDGDASLDVVHPAGVDPVAIADVAAGSVPFESPDGRRRVARRGAGALVVRAVAVSPGTP
ncbi:MAG: glycosyltransferase family A protein [Brevundimonas sp.]